MESFTMSNLGITEFDPADALDTPERIAAYIQLVAEETDSDAKAMTKALGVAVRAQKALATVAAEVDLTRQGLAKALSGETNTSFDNILKIARAAGVRIRWEVAA
ncbi:addiction module antidote protein [Brevundimonas sp. CEF1]|uniref:addiction module antidote protein n=1 Tax=Brevundimonas sp. CEF1 TaxID=3442642 RepID=UPI003F50EB47